MAGNYVPTQVSVLSFNFLHSPLIFPFSFLLHIFKILLDYAPADLCSESISPVLSIMPKDSE